MYLPGTKINVDSLSSDNVKSAFSHIFSTGGLVLSQVVLLGDMELHTVQNWVKRGFCTPPIAKKYNIRQFCRIITINMLKDSMNINEIISLISYINGRLDDESDDIIADDTLYFMFVEILFRTVGHTLDFDREIDGVLDDFEIIIPDNRKRLSTALQIMLYAYKSVQYRHMVNALIQDSGILQM